MAKRGRKRKVKPSLEAFQDHISEHQKMFGTEENSYVKIEFGRWIISGRGNLAELQSLVNQLKG